MSVFTRLSCADVKAFLQNYDCGDLIQFDEIIEGVTNSNFRLKTTKGTFILTVYEQLDTATLQSLHDLQNLWHEKGLNCAKVIKNDRLNTLSKLHQKPAALVEHLPGSTHFKISSTLCKQVGLTLARIHLSPQPQDFNRNNPRGFDWMLGMAKRIYHNLSTVDQTILDEELNFLRHFSSLALPAGAIHADFFPDNVLVHEDHIQGFIDLDFACREIYLFDICVAINAWCNDDQGQLNRLLMRDLLTAYTSLRPLNQEENLAIPMMLRATALRFWLSRLYDHIYLEGSEKIQHKDPQEFKNILLNRRNRLSGMQR
ncbi:MAG: homoserine kinase [Gammaproteobacteria bacterium]|nr:homoserine kinase [Gammaproteobacteria bacterium]